MLIESELLHYLVGLTQCVVTYWFVRHWQYRLEKIRRSSVVVEYQYLERNFIYEFIIYVLVMSMITNVLIYSIYRFFP